MVTTIQISDNLLKKLGMMKMHAKESYENIIWDLIEDRLELSEKTKKNIEQSRKEIIHGKTIPFDKIKKKYKYE